MSANEELCPCCGQPLPLGLFAKRLVVELPAAVAAMDKQGGGPAKSELKVESGELTMLEVNGRAFCRAEMPLPLTLPESPVRAQVWIEIEDSAAAELIVASSQGQSIVGQARIACDLPGFRGLLGAACEWQSDPATGTPRITGCTDERLQTLPERPDHNGFVALYRELWGNPYPVADADVELRAALIGHWHKLIDRPLFRKAIEPPPNLAGFRAPEIVVSPPLDTGGEAVLGTIGCAEQPGPDGGRSELVTWALDPSEEFIQSFAEFCFLSRINAEAISSNAIVPERRGIPGTDGMKGWLLVTPWWLDGEMTSVSTEAGEVSVLAAIPVHEVEMAYAAGLGISKLAELLRESEAPIADLSRGPAIDVIGPEAA